MKRVFEFKETPLRIMANHPIGSVYERDGEKYKVVDYHKPLPSAAIISYPGIVCESMEEVKEPDEIKKYANWAKEKEGLD